MAKAIATAPAVTFGAAQFVTLSVALVAAGTSIDKATDKASETLQAWALSACTGLKVNALTMDQVKDALISATNAKRTKATKAATIADCGNTLKGWYYGLNRIVKANVADRIIQGEAFWTVARSTAQVQTQATKGGKGKPKTTATAPTSPTVDEAPNVTVAAVASIATASIKDMAAAIKAYRKRNDVKQYAKDQADFARIMADIQAMGRAIEAAAKASVPVAKAA